MLKYLRAIPVLLTVTGSLLLHTSGCNGPPENEATPPTPATVLLRGRFTAQAGPIAVINFYDEGHFALWLRDCEYDIADGNDTRCMESGTYAIDQVRGVIVLNNANDKTSERTFTFATTTTTSDLHTRGRLVMGDGRLITASMCLIIMNIMLNGQAFVSSEDALKEFQNVLMLQMRDASTNDVDPRASRWVAGKTAIAQKQCASMSKKPVNTNARIIKWRGIDLYSFPSCPTDKETTRDTMMYSVFTMDHNPVVSSAMTPNGTRESGAITDLTALLADVCNACTEQFPKPPPPPVNEAKAPSYQCVVGAKAK